jgi:hypothetical protein
MSGPAKPGDPKNKKKLQFTEFECPECTAHNPNDNGFSFGDEIFCNWCGAVFSVRKTDDELKFRLVIQ